MKSSYQSKDTNANSTAKSFTSGPSMIKQNNKVRKWKKQVGIRIFEYLHIKLTNNITHIRCTAGL